MFNKRKIIAIVPARSGSKGLKNKNLKKLINYPLLAYPIKAAIKSKYIDTGKVQVHLQYIYLTLQKI